jgi:hypothetical protein
MIPKIGNNSKESQLLMSLDTSAWAFQAHDLISLARLQERVSGTCCEGNMKHRNYDAQTPLKKTHPGLSDALSDNAVPNKPVEQKCSTWDRTILPNPMSDRLLRLACPTWHRTIMFDVVSDKPTGWAICSGDIFKSSC